MIRFGEASSSDKAAAEKKSMEFVKAERPVTQQVFNCGETGLFWKKMPNCAYIMKKEKALLGLKPMKDRLSVLLYVNANAHLQVKPVLVHHSLSLHAFKKPAVNKGRLAVTWRVSLKP